MDSMKLKPIMTIITKYKAHLCGRNVVHLVVWTTKECAIIIMEKDDEWATINIPKLVSFCDNLILLKIVHSDVTTD